MRCLPLIGSTLTERDRAFFYARLPVARTVDGCLLWQGARTPRGYGTTYVGGRPVSAHRVSWVLHNGDLVAGEFVLHTCDVRDCVEPAHLFLGDNAVNMQDAWQKGRGRAPYVVGEHNPRARLRRDQVVEILGRERQGERQIDLAGEFGVTRGYVSMLVSRRSWKSITEAEIDEWGIDNAIPALDWSTT